MVDACVSLVWGLTKHSDSVTKIKISEKIGESPELVDTCCKMLKYYPGRHNFYYTVHSKHIVLVELTTPLLCKINSGSILHNTIGWLVQ